MSCNRWRIIIRCYNRFFSTDNNFKPYEDINNKDLYCCNVPIKLKRGETVTLNAVIQDTMPKEPSKGTLIAIHGAPGSHKDFKYMVPHFTEKKVRVIGLNLPGLGYTSRSDDDRLMNVSYERDQFIDAVISKICIVDDHPLVIAGHSRGSVDAIRLSLRMKRSGRNIKAVAPINLVGLKPHRGIRPYVFVKYAARMWNVYALRRFLSPIYFQFYNRFLNFRSSGETAAICIQAMANIDFEEQRRFVSELDRSRVRIFSTFASKDFITEVEISQDFTNILTDNVELECAKSDDEDRLIKETIRQLRVHRHVSVNFTDDGHFLQKHRAKFLSECINMLYSLPPMSSV